MTLLCTVKMKCPITVYRVLTVPSGVAGILSIIHSAFQFDCSPIETELVN